MRSTTSARIIAALALAAGAAAPTLEAADAAPPRSCEHVRDAAGDSGLLGGEGGGGPVPGTYDASVDIVSADVATHRTHLTAVIRVEALTIPAQPTPYGAAWSMHFATPEAAFFLEAKRTLDGDRFHLSVYTTPYSGDTSQSYLYDPLGAVSGVIDGSRNEVRLTAPLSMFAPYDKITAGAPITKLLAISWITQAVMEYPGANTQADEGSSTASYPAGARSCVKVGA